MSSSANLATLSTGRPVGPLARVPAAVKFAVLFVAGIGLSLITDWRVLALLLCGAVVALLLTRPPVRRLLRPIVTLLIIIAAVMIMTGFGSGIESAVITGLRLLAVCLFAYAVSLSTRFAEMLDLFTTVLSPLARLGLDPGRISLALALTVRFIPQIRDDYLQVREAQYARGLQHRPVATVVPLIIRTLQSAEQIAEAIDARCYDSRTGPHQPTIDR